MTKAELIKRPVVEFIQELAPGIAKRLPPTMNATRYLMAAATLVQNNPDLLECEPLSLQLGIYQAAELGVSLSPSLGLAFLIPYKDKADQKPKAQFQIGWRGLVQLGYQSGCLKTFYAESVFGKDKFERQYAPKRNLFHPPADGDRGELVGAYALVEFLSGVIDWEFCDKALIERHRKHSKFPNSLMWSHFYEEAARKTAIRILAKRLPLSNPGMEVLAEAAAHDQEVELEAAPAGRLELDEPQAVPEKKVREIGSARDPEDNGELFYKVGEQTTTVWGKTYLLKDEFPGLGGKWNKNARHWEIAAARTHELLEVAEKKQITATEVMAEAKGPEAEMLWREEK